MFDSNQPSHISINISLYIYLYIHVCVCVSISVTECVKCSAIGSHLRLFANPLTSRSSETAGAGVSNTM